MGLLWWKSKGKSQKPNPKPTEVPGMNGAVEVPRRPPSDVTVFEFGSVANSTDKVTLAGYCPVSDELEPCRWEILPAKDSDAPQFRIVFWNFFTFLLFWCFEPSIRNVFLSSVSVVISLFWIDDFEWNIEQGEKCLVGSCLGYLFMDELKRLLYLKLSSLLNVQNWDDGFNCLGVKKISFFFFNRWFVCGFDFFLGPSWLCCLLSELKVTPLKLTPTVNNLSRKKVLENELQVCLDYVH